MDMKASDISAGVGPSTVTGDAPGPSPLAPFDTNALALVGWAESVAGTGDPEVALAAARVAVLGAPEVAFAHTLQVLALERLQRDSEALEALEVARALDGDRDPSLLSILGRLLWRTGRIDHAIEAYAAALVRRPNLTEAREALAALGPGGLAKLAHFEQSQRPIRLAGSRIELWLDGRGRPGGHFPEDRDRHPELGPAPFNVGDQFVGMALPRLLRVESFLTIGPGATDAAFDRINQECDCFVVRGSCFLFPGFFESRGLAQALRRIKIPIVFIGAGIQFALDEEMHLLPSDIASLKHIHDSCASTSVRGYRSAELLARYGITNVRPTGCPTILWNQTREASVRAPTLARVAWTITEINHLPGLDQRQFGHMQRLFEAAGRTHMVGQGGELPLQQWVAFRDHHHHGHTQDRELGDGLTRSTHRASEAGFLRSELAFRYRHWPAPMLEALETDGFFGQDVHDYFHFLRQMTMVVGTRLHGNMMALVQGVPSVFCVHDARLAEMAEFMGVPSFRIEEEVDFRAPQWDWAAYLRRVPEIYDAFVAYFEENDLPHRLVPHAAPFLASRQEVPT